MVQSSARMIEAGFDDYLARFRLLTQAAEGHFLRRDFHAIQANTKYRLRLYKDSVRKICGWLSRDLGQRRSDQELWLSIRETYAVRVAHKPTCELAQTYFNSVYRKVPMEDHRLDVMFVAPERPDIRSPQRIFRRHFAVRPLPSLIHRILNRPAFEGLWEDLDRDVQRVAGRMQQGLLKAFAPGSHPDRHARVELLKPAFYRNKAAYLVGRVVLHERAHPFLLPILHGPEGLYVDAVIDDPDTVSIVFGFTRSYFLVDVDIPSEMVDFLGTLIPQKPKAELYNSIGFNKHGKTELYRSFAEHIAEAEDKLCVAPGIRGMVMAVFHLPSYPIVFKVIKDRFEPPKSSTREEVKAKYKLVSQHDRVGRMADTHEFVDFRFPRERFDPALLEELRACAGSLLVEEGHTVVIRHLYTERRMTPLNLYLEAARPEQAEAAVADYGLAIRQLAAANIFPGDMLLKNFGVTRHLRVVFYDYDEILFLTECRFRHIPAPRRPEDEWSGELPPSAACFTACTANSSMPPSGKNGRSAYGLASWSRCFRMRRSCASTPNATAMGEYPGFCPAFKRGIFKA
jgi:isocitrate dehydrogenase kinase/phosphatase